MPRSALALCALLFLGGCRDAAQPFDVNDRPRAIETSPRRLTFSAMDDRAPTWNATSDSVYYSGFSEDLLPDAPATLLAIPIEPGGVATPALPAAQFGIMAQRWYVAPVRAPDDDRIAWVDLEPLNAFWRCPSPETRCDYNNGSSPRLVAATLRVRSQGADGPPQLGPRLPLDLESSTDTIVIPGFEAYLSYYPPYQEEYIDSRSYSFRPTWAPDGERIAVSDGRHIVVWRPTSGDVDTIPGTLDGMEPAWSPDGSTIAFTWVERVDSITDHCEFGAWDSVSIPPVFITDCYETRVKYVTTAPRIVTIAPDGTDWRVLAEGREPTWLPDGRLAYSDTAEGPLRIHDPASDETAVLVGTDGAREASASPDGRWIAYSRLPDEPTAPRDIFAVELAP